jgi:transposase
MPPTKPAYPPEFKAEAVRLYRTSNRSLKEVATDLGVSTNALREWVRRAEREGSPAELLSADERAELTRLRRENRILNRSVALSGSTV